MQLESPQQKDAFTTSGTSPTLPGIHLVGPGAVGRELLTLLANSTAHVVAVSDSTGTLVERGGLDPATVRRHKEAGPIAGLPAALSVPLTHALDAIGAPVVCLLLPSDASRTGDLPWTLRALAAQRIVVSAAKHVPCAWPALVADARFGLDAVLGGTGARLQAELAVLREGWRSAALAGSASTTLIVEVLERGGTFDDGLENARRAGVLEPDPELDLRGADAATKLALVAGVLLGRPIPVGTIAAPDLRHVDPALVRERAARGATTRLVGRATREGELSLAFEEVLRLSPLAIPATRVAYTYELADRTVVHVGDGIGPLGTARAVLRDLVRLRAVRAGGVA